MEAENITPRPPNTILSPRNHTVGLDSGRSTGGYLTMTVTPKGQGHTEASKAPGPPRPHAPCVCTQEALSPAFCTLCAIGQDCHGVLLRPAP